MYFIFVIFSFAGNVQYVGVPTYKVIIYNDGNVQQMEVSGSAARPVVVTNKNKKWLWTSYSDKKLIKNVGKDERLILTSDDGLGYIVFYSDGKYMEHAQSFGLAETYIGTYNVLGGK